MQKLVIGSYVTLIRLGFLKVVFSARGGGGGGSIYIPFIFQEKLIQYQYNFMQLLKKLFKVG